MNFRQHCRRSLKIFCEDGSLYHEWIDSLENRKIYHNSHGVEMGVKLFGEVARKHLEQHVRDDNLWWVIMKGRVKGFLYSVKFYGLRKCLFVVFSVLVSDVCVVSYQRSGKTWLRLMLGKIISLKHECVLRLDTQFMTLFKKFPNVFFTHGGSTKRNNVLKFKKLFRLRGKRVVLLVRDPRDQIVSSFHSVRKRSRVYSGDSISSFIRDKDWGVGKIISFMNLWAEDLNERGGDFCLLRYEDLRRDTAGILRRFLSFLGVDVDDCLIDKAVCYGSFDNMRRLELGGSFRDGRMRPSVPGDVNSYKTRKGVVGGYRDELCQEDIDYLNKEIREKLNPLFSY